MLLCVCSLESSACNLTPVFTQGVTFGIKTSNLYVYRIVTSSLYSFLAGILQQSKWICSWFILQRKESTNCAFFFFICFSHLLRKNEVSQHIFTYRYSYRSGLRVCTIFCFAGFFYCLLSKSEANCVSYTSLCRLWYYTELRLEIILRTSKYGHYFYPL